MPAKEGPRSNEPELSIIIVSYNTGEALEHCLHALAPAVGNLTCEVIVVDNHSSDGTPATLREEFPEVVLIENEINVGFGRAFNQGARRAKAPFLLSLNGDCVPEPGALSILLKAMRRAPQAGAMGPRLLRANEQDAESAFRFPSLFRPLLNTRLTRLLAGEAFSIGYQAQDPRLQHGGPVDWLSGACLMMRKSAVEPLGYFDERYFMYFEDVDICRRMRCAGWEVVFCTESRVSHVGGVSATGAADDLAVQRQRSRLIYFSTWEGRVSYELMRAWTAVAAIGRALRLLVTFRWTRLEAEARILLLSVRGVDRKESPVG
jgi:GT2 family glycosyltransferase